MATNNNNVEAFKGSWDYISANNFDEILKEIGFNKVLRTLAKTVKPRVVIEEKNGKWVYRTESVVKTTSFEFVPGVEFEDTLPTGDKMTMTIRFEDGKWLQNVRYKNGKQMFVQRTINDQDQLEVIMEIGNVKGNQLFKRVA